MAELNPISKNQSEAPKLPTREAWNNALRQRIGSGLCDYFSAASVAVCGLGGLGSAIAVLLARAGIGRLILIDFDRVDLTNLHRQQYKASQVGRLKTDALCENLKELAPYTVLEPHTVRINADNAVSLLESADIVCEAFDDAECKAMLANTVLACMPDKYLIAASGMSGLADANAIHTRKITEHFYLCGDEISDSSDGPGLFAPRVMLCAAHQAHAVLRILTQTQYLQKEGN